MEKKIRIAFVLKSSIYSGAENVAISIIKGLENRYEFLYIATQGQIEKKLIEEKVTYHLLPKFSLNGLNKALLNFKPDIVHAHDFTATVYCAIYQKSQKYKLISHMHYDPMWARRWNLRTLTYLILSKRVTKIIAVTRTAFSNNVFANRVKNKTIYLNNPIDIKKIRMKSEERKDESFDILFIGRLVEQKDPLLFINIVRECVKYNKNIKCAMIGDGELKQQCKNAIKELGIECELKLLGYQENPYSYIKNSRLVCMTSKWEGFGLIIAEANILGIPVLSTKNAGAMEIFGEQAIEICDKPEIMVNKISNILKNENEYDNYKKRAEARINSFISIEQYICNINKVYQEE